MADVSPNLSIITVSPSGLIYQLKDRDCLRGYKNIYIAQSHAAYKKDICFISNILTDVG